ETYSSKVLRNAPRWRRSKESTAPSGVRPANGLSTTEREMPAAAASRAMADRKALKSPPHVAALAGAARSRVQNRMATDRNCIGSSTFVPAIIAHGIGGERGERQVFRPRLCENAFRTTKTHSRHTPGILCAPRQSR